MNLHKHARLTPRGRALLVQRIEQGLRVEDAAQAAGVSVRTAYKWLRRFREEGEAGLQDRSSRPGFVSVQPSHLPNSNIKGDGVRIFLSGRDRP
jgi:transposase-like protein